MADETDRPLAPSVDAQDLVADGGRHEGLSRRSFLSVAGVASAAVASASPDGLDAIAAVGGRKQVGSGSLTDIFGEFTNFFPADMFDIPNLAEFAGAINFVGGIYHSGQASQRIALKVPASVLEQGRFSLSIPGITGLKFIAGPEATLDVDVYLQIQVEVAASPVEISLTFTGCAFVPAGDPEPDESQYSLGIPMTFQITRDLFQPKVVASSDSNGVPTAFTDKLDDNGDPSDYFLRILAPPSYQYGDATDPQIRVSFGTNWNLELLDAAGDPIGFGSALETPDPAEVAGSGVIVQLNQFGLNLDRSTPPETQGLYLNADIFFTTQDNSNPGQEKAVFEASVLGLDASGNPSSSVAAIIGPGGFTGAVKATFPGGLTTDIFDTTVTLNSADIEIKQNALQGADLRGSILLPWMDHTIDVLVAFHLNNDLSITLDTSKHPATVSLPSVADFSFKTFSIDYDFQTNVARFTTDCTVKPTFSLPPINTPPPFDLTGLTFEPPDKISLKGGWIDLKHAEQMAIAGFNMDLTKIGFGSRGDTATGSHSPAGQDGSPSDHFIGFSGAISLGDGLPQGISVEGLRVYYDPSTYALTGFDLKGIGLKLSVPGSFSFDGSVELGKETFSDGNQYDVISGSVDLMIIPLNLRLDARLLIITKPFPAFFIDVSTTLPSPGVMLGTSGLALYGIEGLYAYHMAPNKSPDEDWYGDATTKTGWYWKSPSGQINDPLKKWVPMHGANAFGVGVTLGTASDNGHAFAMKALLVLTLPGPVIIVQGAADFLKGRDGLAPGKSPPFQALMIIDPSDITINVGVHATFPSSDKQILKVDADAEVFFDLNDPRNWHLYIGQEPPEKRVQAQILKLFKANSYFMLTNDWLKLGAHIGYDVSWGDHISKSAAGVSVSAAVQVKFSAYIDGEAQITRRPLQLEGSLHAHGELSVKIVVDVHVHIHIPIPFSDGITIDFKLHFALGFSFIIDATVTGQAPQPFAIKADLSISVQVSYLGSISVDIPFSFGEDPIVSLPDLQSVLERDESSGLLNINLVHPLAAQLHDASGNPFTSLPAQTPADASLAARQAAVTAAKSMPVPVDWRPVVTFKQDVHNDSGFGDPQSPVPSSVTLEDYTYDYHLTGVKIYESDTNGNRVADVTSSFGGKWQLSPGSGAQPGQRVLVINSNDALLFLTSTTSTSYGDWVSGAYPYWCCGLPLNNPPPLTVVPVAQGQVTTVPNPTSRTTPFGIRGVTFDPQGTLAVWDPNTKGLNAQTLAIDFPTAVNDVTLRFWAVAYGKDNPMGTGQAFFRGAKVGSLQTITADPSAGRLAYKMTFHVKARTGMDTIEFAGQGLGLYEVTYRDEGDVLTFGDAATLSTTMETWTASESDHWNLDLAIFKPNTVYRLELVTTAHVSAAQGSKSATNPETLNGTGPDIAFFATGGPPIDDAGVAVGKYPLTPYLNYQLPVPGSGFAPPVVPPLQNGWTLPGDGDNQAFLAYDVNVGFNQPWVTAMFTTPGGVPDMRIQLYDKDGQPVAGNAVYVGDIDHQNTLSEQTCIDIVDASGCGPGSITLSAGKMTSLSSLGLTSNSVYRAELHWTDAASADHVLYRWGFKTGVFNTFSDLIASFDGAVWPFQAGGVDLAALGALVNGSDPEAVRFDEIATLFHRDVTIGTLPSSLQVTLVESTTPRGLERLGLLLESPQPIDWAREGTAVAVARAASIHKSKVSRRELLRAKALVSMTPTLVRGADGTRAFLFFPSGSSFDVPKGQYTLTWTFVAKTSNPSDPIYTVATTDPADEHPAMVFVIP